MNTKLSAAEVCVLLNVSLNTLNKWYRFKTENPEHEFAKYIPEPKREGSGIKAPRYWTQSDIKKLAKFQSHIKRGRNGFIGLYTGKERHDKERLSKV